MPTAVARLDSWKLFLNLCSFTQMIYPNSKSCELFNSTGIVYIELTISTWFDEFEILLKALTNSEFWKLLSSLFHSNSGWGKKECQKYSCLILNKGTLLWFMVARVYKTSGIKSKISRACSYQWVKNFNFLEDFAYMRNKWSQRPLFRLTVLVGMSCMVKNKEVLSKMFPIRLRTFWEVVFVIKNKGPKMRTDHSKLLSKSPVKGIAACLLCCFV